jgi:ferric-dicitrate binding protein FerR (iron transport regulator)
MATIAADSNRFRQLFLAATENRLTAAQHDEWNALLQTDPAARREYLRLANLHGTLHQCLGMEAGEESSELQSALAALVATSAAEEPRQLRLPRLFWPVAASILFAVTILLAYSRSHPAKPPTLAALSESSATITGLINVAWEDPALTLPLDAHLPTRPLRLRAGLLRVELPTGTQIIVQGPAQFQFDADATFKLQRGNMTAHVPHQGIGFTVTTPNATVTDLGTEFGVYVNRDDQTHAEVFTGKVRLSANTDTGASTFQILEAGHAAQILDESTGIESAVSEPLAFVRPDQFAEIERNPANPVFARWRSFSSNLRNDPNLLAYYDFEPSSSSTELRNVSAVTAGKSDGVISGAEWTAGRVEGKHALRFNGESRIDMNIPAPLEAVTVTAWVNSENLKSLHQEHLHGDHNGAFSGILMTDGAHAGAVHWQFMDGVRTELGIGLSDSAAVLFSRYRSMDLLSSQDDGRWMFVAVVIDTQNRRIRHYFDGVLAGRNNESMQDDNLAIGEAEIGNWKPLQRKDHPDRGFVGRMDELAVFNRILSEEEIRSMYAAGSGG